MSEINLYQALQTLLQSTMVEIESLRKISTKMQMGRSKIEIEIPLQILSFAGEAEDCVIFLLFQSIILIFPRSFTSNSPFFALVSMKAAAAGNLPYIPNWGVSICEFGAF